MMMDDAIVNLIESHTPVIQSRKIKKMKNLFSFFRLLGIS